MSDSPPRLRQATPGDATAIVEFTRDTFTWGDYVPDLIDEWLADDEGIVIVAVDDEDVPIAMARAVFLTDREVWSHAARVHPDHRGRRIAGQLAEALMNWATERGGQVVRLLIDDDNVASINHISRLGFRRAVSVVRASRAVGAASPNPAGNGGRRHPSALRARPGKRQDIQLVRASWSTSEVGRSLRGLIGEGWRFHRLTDDDIEDAARRGALFEVGSSWVIADQQDEAFNVGWVDTTPDEAHEVIKALVDVANNRGAELVTMWLADTVWLVQAARRTGFEVSGHGVWEHAL